MRFEYAFKDLGFHSPGWLEFVTLRFSFIKLIDSAYAAPRHLQCAVQDQGAAGAFRQLGGARGEGRALLQGQ